MINCKDVAETNERQWHLYAYFDLVVPEKEDSGNAIITRFAKYFFDILGPFTDTVVLGDFDLEDLVIRHECCKSSNTGPTWPTDTFK